ncbi:hypothetical protein JXB01_00905 [Candidatus Micrarchaeota archaeon]|nr:hypothetical protein [Candidatus Micrarchaeota archaeon]
MLLAEKLDEISERIRELKKQLEKTNKNYKKTMDRDYLDEANKIKKKINIKRKKAEEEIFENIEEFRLIKKHFPDFCGELSEDEYTGKIVKKLCWLAEFRELTSDEAIEKFNEIKIKRGEIKDLKDFLGKWSGEIDSKSLTATWEFLKGKINGKMEREEVLDIADRIDSQYKKEGWLVVCNPPYAKRYLKKFLEKCRISKEELDGAERNYKKSIGRGTVAESEAKKEYLRAKRRMLARKRNAEKFLRINPSLLASLKKTSVLFREFTPYESKIIQNIPFRKINEQKWLEQMKELLEV